MKAEPTAVPATGPPVPAQPGRDERQAHLSRVTRALQRPELGALLGAIAIFVLFAATDSTPQHLWLTQTGVASWTAQAAFFGIMAVPVGLLMIGGEFDLSAGVMTLRQPSSWHCSSGGCTGTPGWRSREHSCSPR